MEWSEHPCCSILYLNFIDSGACFAFACSVLFVNKTDWGIFQTEFTNV